MGVGQRTREVGSQGPTADSIVYGGVPLSSAMKHWAIINFPLRERTTVSSQTTFRNADVAPLIRDGWAHEKALGFPRAFFVFSICKCSYFLRRNFKAPATLNKPRTVQIAMEVGSGTPKGTLD